MCTALRVKDRKIFHQEQNEILKSMYERQEDFETQNIKILVLRKDFVSKILIFSQFL